MRRVQVNTETDPNARGHLQLHRLQHQQFQQRLSGAGHRIRLCGFSAGPSADHLRPFRRGQPIICATGSPRRFFQDDWRAERTWTVNYGVRYEYFLPQSEKYGHLSDLSFGPGFTSPAVVTGQNPGSLPPSLIHSDAHNFSPRMGIAYRPWIQHHLVMRSGYGIFYDGSIYSRMVTQHDGPAALRHCLHADYQPGAGVDAGRRFPCVYRPTPFIIPTRPIAISAGPMRRRGTSPWKTSFSAT